MEVAGIEFGERGKVRFVEDVDLTGGVGDQPVPIEPAQSPIDVDDAESQGVGDHLLGQRELEFTVLAEPDGTKAKHQLEQKVPDSKAKVGDSLRRRDAWLARNLDEAIVVWDGNERFTGTLLRTLREHLGDDVWEELVDSGS